MIKNNKNKTAGNIAIKKAGNLCKQYMSEYGTYVNEERAVPSIQDGLKPVQRRALFVHNKLGALHNKPHKKVITLTGETLKFHPHSDKAISDVIVSFAHTRYQLVDPQGGFGSPLGDAAAARYIESRLSKFGCAVFDRIAISEMTPNFDGEELEPVALATKVPLSQLNGYSGIGVGLTSGMPSHNLKQLVKGLKYLLTKEHTQKGFFKIVDRPDFGPCLITSSKDDVKEAYKSGRGAISFLPKYSYIKDKDGVLLHLEGAPPNKNLKKTVERIKAEYQAEGLIDYVEENDGREKTINGDRPKITITVRAANKRILSDSILPMFASSFNLAMVAVDTAKNKKVVPLFNFYQFNLRWLEHQQVFKKKELELLLKKKDYDYRMTEARYRIVSVKANVDKLIKIVRSKKDTHELYITAIQKAFKLDEEQATSLYNSQIRTLSNLNIQALKDKIKDLKNQIKDLKNKLKNIPQCIIDDLDALNKEFGDDNETLYLEEFSVKGQNIKGKSTIIGLSNSGKIYTDDKFPSNVPDYLITPVTSGALIVDNKGLAYEYELEDLVGSVGLKVEGIVSYDYDYALILDDNGKAILLDMEKTNESIKTVFKDIGKIKRVVGLNKGDTVYATKEKYDPMVLTVNTSFINKYCKRIGSAGTLLYAGHKKDVDFYILRKNGVILYKGKEVSEKRAILLMRKGERVTMVSEENIKRKGKVEIVDMDTALGCWSNIIQ